MSGGLFFLFIMLFDVALLFGQVFYTVMYQDLASDYINPIDLVNRLNPYIRPEMAAHAFLSFLLLVTGNWWSFALNAPVIAWNARRLMDRDTTLDATEIFRTLSGHQKESYSKLGFYVSKMMMMMMSCENCRQSLTI